MLLYFFFFLMIRRPPRSTRTDTLFPYTTLFRSWKADESGNLIFRKTARNFNQPMATAAKICVAEVEEIVPTGSLDPDAIHLPGIYVKRMIVGAPYDKRIEFRTVRSEERRLGKGGVRTGRCGGAPTNEKKKQTKIKK